MNIRTIIAAFMNLFISSCLVIYNYLQLGIIVLLLSMDDNDFLGEHSVVV